MHNQVNFLGYLYGNEQTFPFFVHAKTDFVAADELEQLIKQIRVIGVEAKIVSVSNVMGGRIRLNLGTGPAKRQAIPRRRTDM